MKTNVKLIFSLIVVCLLSSCDKDLICKKGDGNVSSKTIDLASFTGVNLDLPGDVIISQGSVQEIILTGDLNVINAINTQVVSGIWNIDFGTKCFKNYNLTVNMVIPDLSKVNISGSGDIVVNDFNNIDQMNSSISGSGDIVFNQLDQCESISLNISGSGSISAFDSVSVEDMEILISGSGELNVFYISAENCNVDISGSGEVEVFVEDLLDVDISGSGEVRYKGSPAITQSISGSGSVIDAN